MTDPLPRQTILIVDDVPANIRALVQSLPDGYDIRVTTSGEEAVEIASDADPLDLILLDIVMPGMDGYEVCRRLKADEATKGIPVIFITGRSEEEEEARGLSLGAVDYIIKPFSPDVVRARVTAQLDLKRYRDRLEDLVDARTAALSESNRQLQRQIAERKLAQEALKRSHDELERRVAERTLELSETNARLREEIKKQEMSIELAKKILGLVNGTPPRHIPMGDGRSLFVDAVNLPSHAEGGDHFLIRPAAGGGATLFSLKDQSGHAVGCVLRSIITDMLHNELIEAFGADALEETMAALNDRICRLDMGGDQFFTAVAGVIDHGSLRLRYVSAGHPALLLIRKGAVTLLPPAEGEGGNLPMGIRSGIPYTSGEVRLHGGDQLIAYTDGLTEMPLMSGGEMITAEELGRRVEAVVRRLGDGRGGRPRVFAVMDALLAEVSRISGQRVRTGCDGEAGVNTSDDDVSLLCLEIEDAEAAREEVWQIDSPQEIRRRIDDLCDRIAEAGGGHGLRGDHLRMVLGEAVINAWFHGNREDPEKPVIIRWRLGNDLHLTVIDQGSGFDACHVPDPTLDENLTKPTGRGLFIIRHYAEQMCWKRGGRQIEITLRPDPPVRRSDNGETPIEERKKPMELSVSREGDRARFHINGMIDEKGAEELKRRFRELNLNGLDEVVFDFKDVTHIGSAGIGKLLLFYKDMALKDGRVSIRNASQTIYELFNVLKLNTIFQISKA